MRLAPYLTWMTAFLVAVAVVAAWLAPNLETAFLSNPFLNALLIAVWLFGVAYIYVQTLRLGPEIAWVQAVKRNRLAVNDMESPPMMMTLAQTLLEIAKTIPPEINWVLRVDGHTDRRPIRTAEFPNNWVLSTARATAVVQYLIAQGVPPGRLAAAGFAEYQPVEAGDDDAALARNRRIELKFDQR